MVQLSCKQEFQLIRAAREAQAVPVGDDTVGFVTLMRICRDYVSDCYPLVKGEERDKWLIERLNKYRIRFFDKI
jgi:hypothetical protein